MVPEVVDAVDPFVLVQEPRQDKGIGQNALLPNPGSSEFNVNRVTDHLVACFVGGIPK
jgi:hypothetical protein